MKAKSIKTVEVKEVNILKWYQSLFMTIGKIALLIIVLWLISKLKPIITLFNRIKSLI